MKAFPHFRALVARATGWLGLAALGSGFAFVQVHQGPQPPEIEALKVRTTAYTHSEADHRVYGRQTAMGTTLQAGELTTAAADWSFMPVGTKFRIVGEETLYTVEDYGSALVGTETVDIYRPSRSAMNAWGVRHVEIEIVERGSVEKSIALLEGRKAWRHCREMLERLKDPSGV